MGCWLFRGEILIFKESVERPALFCADYWGGRRVVKWIKNTLSVFNPLKLVNLGVFRGFRDDFFD